MHCIETHAIAKVVAVNDLLHGSLRVKAGRDDDVAGFPPETTSTENVTRARNERGLLCTTTTPRSIQNLSDKEARGSQVGERCKIENYCAVLVHQSRCHA